MAQSSFTEMILNGTWSIQSRNGEWLDVIEAGEEKPPRLTTTPLSRNRHQFRIRGFEHLASDRLAVWAEPVKRTDAAQPVTTSSEPGGYLFPFVLVHKGCTRFELEALPEEHWLQASARSETARHVTGFVREHAMASGGLPVSVTAFDVLNSPSYVNFPQFEGDQKTAFNAIAAQLTFDPHSSLLTLAKLQGLQRPPAVPEGAWSSVVEQLRKEINFRELVGGYFTRVQDFVQNVFIANAGLADNVGAIVSLDKSDTVQFLMNAAFSAMAKGVGGLGFTGAGVVSGALGVLFEQLAKDKGPSATEFTVALVEARNKMANLFDALITAVQNWKQDVFRDWGKLRVMGVNLERGELAWPDNDEEMRKEARRQLEISLFRDMLKVRWNHMRASNDPSFHTTVDWLQGYVEKNKNYWMTYVATTQKDLFGKETKGFNVTSHWLGRGSTIFDHREPDDRLPIRLFNELKVPREEVFTRWGLKPQTFIVNTGGGIR